MKKRIQGTYNGAYKGGYKNSKEGIPHEEYDKKYVERYEKYHSEEEAFYNLYPETCQKYTPYIEKYLDRYDHSFFKKVPSKSQFDKMTHEVYRYIEKENRELVDLKSNDGRPVAYYHGPFGGSAFFAGGFLGPFLGALLIAAILRRRRRFFPYYGHYGY